MTARITAHADFQVAEVDRRLFGSFVEHMGRCVYSGLYEPTHPDADENGFRRDVLELVRESGVTLVRYPGGNFVSGYRWEDGVGPKDERPARLDLAWRSVETNQFGLNEFVDWAREARVEPMLAVNLGTRGEQDAADLVEYANHPGGTHLSDLRRQHGYGEPHKVRLWCLGNEMDAPWQLGTKPATEYGRLANEAAKMMRLVDPDIELVACGSSMRSMPTFATWESQVLEHCFDQVDYISLHSYFEERDEELPAFLASSLDMDLFIEEVVATVDHVAARKRSRKRIMLAFDEWNVWFQQHFDGPESLRFQAQPRLIEDTYDIAAALVVGTLLISLLRHADRVRIACQAQLVNVIGAVRTEPGGSAWRQTIFHPLAHTARHARGIVLQLAVDCPTYPVQAHDRVPMLDSVATWDPEDGALTFFMVNRDLENYLPVTAGLVGLGELEVLEHLVLAADGDVRRCNTEEAPTTVGPRRSPASRVVGDALETTLDPLSWNVIRLVPASSAAAGTMRRTPHDQRGGQRRGGDDG